MENDNNNFLNNDALQIVPCRTIDNSVVYDATTAQIIIDYYTRFGFDYTPLLKYLFPEFSSPYSNYFPATVDHSPQENIALENRNQQLAEREYRGEVVKTYDTQNKRDGGYLPVRLKRCSAPNDISNNHQIKKGSAETFDKHVSLSTDWFLYRIKISQNGDLGFAVPYKLPELPKFPLHNSDHKLTVQIEYIGSICYKKYEKKLEHFHRYIFEEVFGDTYAGSKSILKFDIKHSNFKLLCLLKKTGDIDDERMGAICSRKNKSIQDPSELEDDELYHPLNLPKQLFYLDISSASSPKRAAMICMNKPDINYFKPCSSTTNKKSNNSSNKVYYFPVEVLRYAPLNQADLQLFYKLPSILVRIEQLCPIGQLRNLLADNIQCHWLPDVDPIPIVSFDDCLKNILSSTQSTVMPLTTISYDLLSSNNGVHLPSLGLLFQAITDSSAQENCNMKSLATLGDSFLKLVMSMSVYHRYPLDDTDVLTEKRSAEISNKNLYHISDVKGLSSYLNTVKTDLHGKRANWIPPGFTVDKENTENHATQTTRWKVYADMIEALIAAFLISTDYPTTIKFMKWLGLDVIPLDEQNRVLETPSVLRMNTANNIDQMNNILREMYSKHSFIDVERRIKYQFKDKAYLIAAFTHSSYCKNHSKINYKRLQFVGDAVLHFLVTRHIFVTKKSPTRGNVTDIRQDVLNRRRIAGIMVDSHLYTKILCNVPKLMEHTKECSINRNNTDQWANSSAPEFVAEVFDALVGAVFFDSNFSLKIVWDVIYPLLRSYIDHSIEQPNIQPVRELHEHQGKLTHKSNDRQGSFTSTVDGRMELKSQVI